MNKDLELWTSIRDHLGRGEPVMLLVVAESVGSSPGRAGYKMAVASSGELIGSIGGGVMEVNLVERCRAMTPSGADKTLLLEQVHQSNSPDSSGMICSGRQTVLLRTLTSADLPAVDKILENSADSAIVLTEDAFKLEPAASTAPRIEFESLPDEDFRYREKLGTTDHLTIIGGGHCARALSEVMSRLGFFISIFDDRAELNTIAKNSFADRVTIIDSYDEVGVQIPDERDNYVVIMTVGYASDAVVLRQLIDRDLKYLGVLGSKAKMATLLRQLRNDGFPVDRLARIHTPIGLQIRSRTPEEIAVSIAAQIISVRNA